MRDDPRYEYKDLTPPGPTTQELRALYHTMMVPDTTMWEKALTFVKLIVGLIVLVGVFLRRKVDQEHEKQVYEREQAGKRREELDNDDLSGVLK